eukprot:867-Amphidinium_carterae.1
MCVDESSHGTHFPQALLSAPTYVESWSWTFGICRDCFDGCHGDFLATSRVGLQEDQVTRTPSRGSC